MKRCRMMVAVLTLWGGWLVGTGYGAGEERFYGGGFDGYDSRVVVDTTVNSGIEKVAGTVILVR